MSKWRTVPVTCRVGAVGDEQPTIAHAASTNQTVFMNDLLKMGILRLHRGASPSNTLGARRSGPGEGRQCYLHS